MQRRTSFLAWEFSAARPHTKQESMKEDLEPRRVISIVVILAIAFIFAINWGPGSRGCETGRRVKPEESSAAMVNGKEIPLRDFSRAYTMQLDRYRMQGMPIPESLAKQVGIPKQVLEGMVNEELWAQAATKYGIAASDTELRDLIVNNPSFQNDGHFDYSRYQDMLTNYYRKTVPEFEAELRKELASQKLRQLVAVTATVSDDEVKARFVKDGNKAQITYVRFLPSMFADKVTAPTPAEIEQFKKDHQKEIKDSYEANKFLYEQPEKVHARHILLKVDKSAPQATKDEVRKKLEDLRKQIVEGGKDFAAVAKESSEDVGSKPSGGDLGFNDKQAWVPEFSAAAFSLKPGEVSQPVETQFGYHLIKVEEKKPAEKKELKDVENEIATNLIKQQKAKQLAQAAAEKALADAKAGKRAPSPAPGAKGEKAPAETKGAEAKGGDELMALFPPEKEGEPAVKRFQTEMKPEAVQTEEFSSSGGSIPNLGQAPELSSAIFAAQGPQLLDKVFAVNDGFVVAKVDSRKLPTDEQFAKDKDKLRAEALRAKQVEVVESFQKALKKSSQITLNDEAIDRVTERG